MGAHGCVGGVGVRHGKIERKRLSVSMELPKMKQTVG